MKTKSSILRYGLIAFALTVVSCDKQEEEMNSPQEAVLEEGFMSSTNNFDSKMLAPEEALKPLLHRSYDGSLSVEEAEKLFREEARIQQKAVVQTNKTSGRFNFSIRTNTQIGRYYGTDASVYAQAEFITDKGVVKQIVELNNPGDDRESGQHDFYEFVAYMPNISWIEVTGAILSLKGTDGWAVDTFSVYGYAHEQTPPVGPNPLVVENADWITIVSENFRPSYLWLDNTTSTGWDHHYIDKAGYGRITF